MCSDNYSKSQKRRIEQSMDPNRYITNLLPYGYQSSSVLTFTYYNPDGPRDLCGEHFDAGILTICLDPEIGLQVRNPKKNEFISFPPETNHSTSHENSSYHSNAAIFGGETLSHLTGARFKSASHKVVLPSSLSNQQSTSSTLPNLGNKNVRGRFSIVFKLRSRPSYVGPRLETDYSLIGCQQRAVEIFNDKSIYHPSIIPHTLLIDIFLYLDQVKDVMKAGLVCQHWNAAVNHQVMWQMMTMSRFGTMGTGEVDWKAEYKSRHQKSQAMRLNPDKLPNPAPREGSMNDPYKLVVVGDGAVGKTSFLLTYASNRFPSEYIPTVFDEYSTNVTLGDSTIHLSLWDTAGQSDYDRLRPLSYPGTDGYIVAYSVTSRSSFDNVAAKWIPEIHNYTPDTPFLLMGNKADAEDDIREVTEMEGIMAANELGAVGFFESSAKELMNVECSVIALIKKTYEIKQTPIEETSKRACFIQ